jgi:hypothetical protein
MLFRVLQVCIRAGSRNASLSARSHWWMDKPLVEACVVEVCLARTTMWEREQEEVPQVGACDGKRHGAHGAIETSTYRI